MERLLTEEEISDMKHIVKTYTGAKVKLMTTMGTEKMLTIISISAYPKDVNEIPPFPDLRKTIGKYKKSNSRFLWLVRAKFYTVVEVCVDEDGIEWIYEGYYQKKYYLRGIIRIYGKCVCGKVRPVKAGQNSLLLQKEQYVDTKVYHAIHNNICELYKQIAKRIDEHELLHYNGDSK